MSFIAGIEGWGTKEEEVTLERRVDRKAKACNEGGGGVGSAQLCVAR
jgi:hypothetical protein